MELKKVSVNFKENTITITTKKIITLGDDFHYTIEFDNVGSSFIYRKSDNKLYLKNQYRTNENILKIIEDEEITEAKAREIIKECILNPNY